MFLKFFQNQQNQQDQQKNDTHELALAKAALLTHVTAADDEIEIQEWRQMSDIMINRLGINKDEVEQIKKNAVQKYLKANDINQFCVTLKKHLNREKRIQFVEDMLIAAHSDGNISFQEDQAISKVSQLIGVETAQRVAIRKNVKLKFSQ